jgi:hypothetical protein
MDSVFYCYDRNGAQPIKPLIKRKKSPLHGENVGRPARRVNSMNIPGDTGNSG